MADSVSLSDLVTAMARRGAPPATESSLFAVLELVEALGSQPRAVDARGARVTSEGGVEIDAGSALCDERTAIDAAGRVMRTVVDPLPPSSRALLDRIAAGHVTSLQSLRGELEALLVPLNRAAAKRVLGRWIREHHRSGGTPASDTDPTSMADAASTDQDGAAVAVVRAAAIDTDPDGAGDGVRGALDTQPDGDVGRAAPPSAIDTAMDGTVVAGASTSSRPSERLATRNEPRRHRGPVVVFLLFLVIGIGLAFALYRMRQRAQDSQSPAQQGPRSGSSGSTSGTPR